MINEATIDCFINDVEKLYNQRVGDAEDGFGREFQELKKQSQMVSQNPKYKTSAGADVNNKTKSRYKDILPFDHSRVKLPLKDGCTSDFINASFIKGPDGRPSYIASQGPLPQTKNDFWRMLWSYKVKVIIMVCREVELGKRKCERYWPADESDAQVFGDIGVSLITISVYLHHMSAYQQHQWNQLQSAIETSSNSYSKRTIIAKRRKETRTLHQFHYTAWPDHGVPRTRNEIISMIVEARGLQDYSNDSASPLCVHCSAGCGRTGAVLVIDYFRNLLLHEKLTANIRVFDVVSSMRTQRPAIVQTKDQYEFVQLAVSELFTKHMNERGKLLNSKLSKALTSTSYENVEINRKEPPKEHKIQQQENAMPAVTVRNDYENVQLELGKPGCQTLPINRNRAGRSPRPVSSFEPMNCRTDDYLTNYRSKADFMRKASDPNSNSYFENHSFLNNSVELLSQSKDSAEKSKNSSDRLLARSNDVLKPHRHSRSPETISIIAETKPNTAVTDALGSSQSFQRFDHSSLNSTEPPKLHGHGSPASMPDIPERTPDSYILDSEEASSLKPEEFDHHAKSAEIATETTRVEAEKKPRRFLGKDKKQKKNKLSGANKKETPQSLQPNTKEPKSGKSLVPGFRIRLGKSPKGARSKLVQPPEK